MPTTIGLKVDDATRKRLKELGERKDRSAHWLMKQAITRYLDQEERYELEKHEDLERWRNFMETGEAFGQEAMAAWFDDLGARARNAPPSKNQPSQASD